jgi:hypothetical protein
MPPWLTNKKELASPAPSPPSECFAIPFSSGGGGGGAQSLAGDGAGGANSYEGTDTLVL